MRGVEDRDRWRGMADETADLTTLSEVNGYWRGDVN